MAGLSICAMGYAPAGVYRWGAALAARGCSAGPLGSCPGRGGAPPPRRKATPPSRVAAPPAAGELPACPATPKHCADTSHSRAMLRRVKRGKEVAGGSTNCHYDVEFVQVRREKFHPGFVP